MTFVTLLCHKRAQKPSLVNAAYSRSCPPPGLLLPCSMTKWFSRFWWGVGGGHLSFTKQPLQKISNVVYTDGARPGVHVWYARLSGAVWALAGRKEREGQSVDVEGAGGHAVLWLSSLPPPPSSLFRQLSSFLKETIWRVLSECRAAAVFWPASFMDHRPGECKPTLPQSSSSSPPTPSLYNSSSSPPNQKEKKAPPLLEPEQTVKSEEVFMRYVIFSNVKKLLKHNSDTLSHVGTCNHTSTTHTWWLETQIPGSEAHICPEWLSLVEQWVKI